MNKENYLQLYEGCQKALAELRLYDALQYIQAACIQLNASDLIEACSDLEQDYNMMLHFMESGGKDPQRKDMHQSFLIRTCNLLYRVHHAYLQIHGDNFISTIIRNNRQSSIDLEASSADLISQLEKQAANHSAGYVNEEVKKNLYKRIYLIQNSLFDFILSADLFNENQKQTSIQLIEQLPAHHACMLLSAFMLNLFEALDFNKLKVLFYFTRFPNPVVQIRALTGFLFVFCKYESLIKLDSAFYQEILMLKENPDFEEDILLIQQEILLSKETDKACRVLNQEILPEIMKSGLNNPSLLSGDLSMEGLKEQLEQGNLDSIFGEKIESLMKMTQTGFDINYNLFSTACRNTFFATFSNWFTPFDINHPEINNSIMDASNKEAMDFITQSSRLCDLDKYAMLHLLNSLPQEMKNQMGDPDMPKDDADEDEVFQMKKKRAIKSYIQDLYRFYTLNLHRKNLYNPITETPFFCRNNSIMLMLHKNHFLDQMIQFLMKAELYPEAIEAIERKLNTSPANAWLLHHLSIACQHEGQQNKALQYAQQAELLEPDNVEILKNLQKLCGILNKHSLQITYLKKMEEIQPLDLNLEMDFVKSLMKCKKFDEAMNRSFKIEFMDEKQTLKHFTTRSIAMCALRLKKHETATKYFAILIQQPEADWQDFLYAGHEAWIAQQQPQAIGYYRKFIELYHKSKEGQNGQWLKEFMETEDILLENQTDPLDICLLRDLIRPQNKE